MSTDREKEQLVVELEDKIRTCRARRDYFDSRLTHLKNTFATLSGMVYLEDILSEEFIKKSGLPYYIKIEEQYRSLFQNHQESIILQPHYNNPNWRLTVDQNHRYNDVTRLFSVTEKGTGLTYGGFLMKNMNALEQHRDERLFIPLFMNGYYGIVSSTPFLVTAWNQEKQPTKALIDLTGQAFYYEKDGKMDPDFRVQQVIAGKTQFQVFYYDHTPVYVVIERKGHVDSFITGKALEQFLPVLDFIPPILNGVSTHLDDHFMLGEETPKQKILL